MHFGKFHGNGNDFIIIDNRDGIFKISSQYIAGLCDRHFGIGADGLITLESFPGYDFSMTYYNSDGNEGSMCGNGGRCIVAFGDLLGIIKNHKVHFTAIDGEHSARILSRSGNEWEIQLQLSNVREADTHFVNTGSPHHIEYTNNLQEINLQKQGPALSHSDKYSHSGGINVNFVQEKDGKLMLRTYERGVESETFSCGTGATATALAYAVKHGIISGPLAVNTQGGTLEVDFRQAGNNTFKDIWLQGPAKKVFEGEI